MGHETEAACLLRSGNLFPRRVGLQDHDGRLTFAGIKHSAFSLYLGDDPHAHFDLEGRWQRIYRDGTHYRKALDGSVDAIERHREGPNLVLRRRSLSFTEIVDLDAEIRDLTVGLLDDLGRGRQEPVPPPPGHNILPSDELQEIFERIAGWDAASWFRHRERYLATYRNLPFLPPDALYSVVLQTTIEGVDRTPGELADHARAVAKLLGRRLAQCRRIFLSGAGFPHRPIAEIVAAMDAINQVMPIGPAADHPRKPSDRPVDEVELKGIDILLDDLAPPLPDREGWARLQTHGLGRISLLIESADPAIRTRFGRCWNNEALQQFARDRAKAGIPLSLILLVGAAGDNSSRHVNQSAQLLASLEWNRGDVIYLVVASDLGISPDAPLGAATLDAERDSLKRQLAPLLNEKSVKVLTYSRNKEWN